MPSFRLWASIWVARNADGSWWAPPDEPLSWVSRWPNLSFVFDRNLFPSLDRLLGDLEAALSGRVTVILDKLPLGGVVSCRTSMAILL